MILSPYRERMVASNPKHVYSPASFPPPSDDWPCASDERTEPPWHEDFGIETAVPSPFRPSLRLRSETPGTISEGQQGVFIKMCHLRVTRAKHVFPRGRIPTSFSTFRLRQPGAWAELTIRHAIRSDNHRGNIHDTRHIPDTLATMLRKKSDATDLSESNRRGYRRDRALSAGGQTMDGYADRAVRRRHHRREDERSPRNASLSSSFRFPLTIT